MIRNFLIRIHRCANKLGSSLALLSLAGSSFVFTSCSTEEGVIAGALAGAAIGGIVGHSQENSYKRNRNVYRSNNYGYRNNSRQSRGRGSDYYSQQSYPQQSRYSDYGGYSDPYCDY